MSTRYLNITAVVTLTVGGQSNLTIPWPDDQIGATYLEAALSQMAVVVNQTFGPGNWTQLNMDTQLWTGIPGGRVLLPTWAVFNPLTPLDPGATLVETIDQVNDLLAALKASRSF